MNGMWFSLSEKHYVQLAAQLHTHSTSAHSHSASAGATLIN